MSTAQTTIDKATYGRLLDAVNSGDAELISKTIDEVAKPDLAINTVPLSVRICAGAL